MQHQARPLAQSRRPVQFAAHGNPALHLWGWLVRTGSDQGGSAGQQAPARSLRQAAPNAMQRVQGRAVQIMGYRAAQSWSTVSFFNALSAYRTQLHRASPAMAETPAQPPSQRAPASDAVAGHGQASRVLS